MGWDRLAGTGVSTAQKIVQRPTPFRGVRGRLEVFRKFIQNGKHGHPLVSAETNYSRDDSGIYTIYSFLVAGGANVDFRNSFGLLLPPIAEHFKVGRAEAALTSSFLTLLTLGSGQYFFSIHCYQ